VKRPLAVCVQVAYGHIDPVRLVEWLEFQRILGVSFVGVHLMEDFSNVSRSVFRYAIGELLSSLVTLFYCLQKYRHCC